MATNLTASELRILRILDSAPNKVEEYRGVRLLTKLSIRGLRIVTNRMVDRNLIALNFDHPTTIGLTFGGMRALAAAQVSA